MKTLIFKDYWEFIAHPEKDINGVSEEFAKEHPDYEKQNETNESCWNCSGCSDCSRCSRCSRCSDCSDCSRCSDCSDCSGCSDCSRCSRCSDCSDCSGCSRCSRCSDCSGCSDCYRCSGLRNASPIEGSESQGMQVPIIENIHQKVLEAVTYNGNKLEMDQWHTCETTHCRAGWVVHLAGEAGRKLEALTSTPFAAMQIYHKSNPNVPVSPVRFYEDNKKAMADIERCAEEEKKATT